MSFENKLNIKLYYVFVRKKVTVNIVQFLNYNIILQLVCSVESMWHESPLPTGKRRQQWANSNRLLAVTVSWIHNHWLVAVTI